MKLHCASVAYILIINIIVLYSQIYEDDDYLYYEDDIYGLSSFVSWLITFGRAAIVLEAQVFAGKHGGLYTKAARAILFLIIADSAPAYIH